MVAHCGHRLQAALHGRRGHRRGGDRCLWTTMASCTTIKHQTSNYSYLTLVSLGVLNCNFHPHQEVNRRGDSPLDVGEN